MEKSMELKVDEFFIKNGYRLYDDYKDPREDSYIREYIKNGTLVKITFMKKCDLKVYEECKEDYLINS
jgi:hypothetical protein